MWLLTWKVSIFFQSSGLDFKSSFQSPREFLQCVAFLRYDLFRNHFALHFHMHSLRNRENRNKLLQLRNIQDQKKRHYATSLVNRINSHDPHDVRLFNATHVNCSHVCHLWWPEAPNTKSKFRKELRILHFKAIDYESWVHKLGGKR